MNLLYPCEDPDGGHLRSLDRRREVMQVKSEKPELMSNTPLALEGLV